MVRGWLVPENCSIGHGPKLPTVTEAECCCEQLRGRTEGLPLERCVPLRRP